MGLKDYESKRKFEKTLEPKPGRNFGEGDIRYITPDVFVQKVGDELVAGIDGLGELRVSVVAPH